MNSPVWPNWKQPNWLTHSLIDFFIYTYTSVLWVCVLVAPLCLTLCNPMDCITYQPPLSLEFSRQENWSGQTFPFLRDLLNLRIEPRSPALQADSLLSKPPEKPMYLCVCVCVCSLSWFSHVQLFRTPWLVAHQASLSMGFQARILKWIAMPSSRGSSQPRDRTCVS